jgi:transcriptional regulator with XRE-family HTH domain
MPSLSERLAQLQTAHSVHKKEIAKAIGMSVMGYYRYETGVRKPDSDTLIALADFFGVSIDYLVGRDDTAPKPAHVVSASDMELIRAYSDASADDRNLIDVILKKYKKPRRAGNAAQKE